VNGTREAADLAADIAWNQALSNAPESWKLAYPPRKLGARRPVSDG
jgi:hypothetical protein